MGCAIFGISNEELPFLMTDLAGGEFRPRNTLPAKRREVRVMLWLSLVAQGIARICRRSFQVLVATATTFSPLA
jgi:hypothetical protein